MDRISDLKSDLEGFVDKKQAEYDGKSDFWQESEKGEELSDFISTCSDVCSNLDDAFNELDNATEGD